MLRLLCVASLLTLSFVTVHAQGATTALQGRWIVTGAEHNGKPMNGLNGGVLTIAGSAFEIRTASGNMLKGSLQADPSTTPARIDMTHADGVQWEAIYEVSGDVLRLNYVVRGEKDPRPAAFTTSEKTEESLVMLRRESRDAK